MRGMNCSCRPGTTSRWPWRRSTGLPSAGPTSATVTGSPRTPICSAAMSRASSQPLTNPAQSLMPSSVEVSYPISSSVSARACTRERLRGGVFGDLQEGLHSRLLALGELVRRGALLRVAQALLGLLEPLAELSRLELVRRDRLGDQHPGAVGEHFEPALALGVALHLAVGRVKAKLGRDQASDHRGVAGQYAHLAHRGPGRELPQVAAEHLAFGRQHLGVESVPFVG